MSMTDVTAMPTTMSLRVNVILLDRTAGVSLTTRGCVSGIVHVQEIAAFLDVIRSTKKDVDFFEGDFSCLWDEEPDEDC
jgi:hypothetical protein